MSMCDSPAVHKSAAAFEAVHHLEGRDAATQSTKRVEQYSNAGAWRDLGRPRLADLEVQRRVRSRRTRLRKMGIRR